MTFTSRANMAVGAVYTAADQNASKGNDDHLHAALLGPIPPAATGGVVRQYVKLTGIANNTATEFATITTTNEAGDVDGGVYHCIFEGLVAHGSAASSTATSCMGYRNQFARAIGKVGTSGANSAVVSSSLTAVAASTVATKTIAGAVMTVVETSEYVMSLRIDMNMGGTTVTTGEIYGIISVYYAGFTTAPVITSIG